MAVKISALNQSKQTQNASSLNYSEMAQSTSFKHLLRKKRNFILPFSLFFLAFYFTLPILTAYSDILNTPALGPISWAWVFAFAQFIMTWTLCIIYTKKSTEFDKIVEEIIEEN
ncbi:DUF485 domain-containing protein [Bacillus methanolicus]|uniref:Putative membrane protein n=1 Tax=Bacillus methanolicus (strain MGA3 / ATCC 53907) TaxID=796606 RepID=I3ECB9_BACMM|nr:DUF485 domain-containing protein [Bacillus methanolicus]AIE61087.1 putative membrane protein [Bacillus methanolicus MGA3]EIJ84140.1 hypothetical protein MGA3_02575 [Bacillus methanolicus MGA3]